MKIINNIGFKEYYCKDKFGNRDRIEYPSISLYVVMTRQCNAKCRFCEYRGLGEEVNLGIFEDTLNKILDTCDIGMVHFTGGEPTLEMEKLKGLIDIIKKKDSLIQTSVNTNGTRLKELQGIETLDNISLSRHHYKDRLNQEIFGIKSVPTLDDIESFEDKTKIHLSCNLIKGYIDSSEQVLNYLEHAAKLGINNVGFVGLMDINSYCKEKFIDFADIEPQQSEVFTKTRCFSNISETTNEVCCKCSNYLYTSKDFKLISMYNRHAIKNNEIADYLVYENNILKQGFNGNKIEI